MNRIGTESFNHLSLSEMRAKYREVRAAAIAVTGQTAKDFDARIVERNEWLSLKAGSLKQARNYLASAFWALESALTVNTFSAPSPETLAWGGFLGGEWFADTNAADEAIRKILAGA